MSKKKPLHYAHDSWDFGLTGDATPYRNATTFYNDLWQRLDERYKTMEELRNVNEQIDALRAKVDQLKV